jgi:hypothetical protein
LKVRLKESNMKLKLALAAGVLAVTALATIPQVTSAATIGPHTQLPGIATGDSLLQQVQRPWCFAVRAECSAYFGGGGWRYRRCVRDRGCYP